MANVVEHKHQRVQEQQQRQEGDTRAARHPRQKPHGIQGQKEPRVLMLLSDREGSCEHF